MLQRVAICNLTNLEPITRGVHPPYYSYITAFSQTGILEYFFARKWNLRSVYERIRSTFQSEHWESAHRTDNNSRQPCQTMKLGSIFIWNLSLMDWRDCQWRRSSHRLEDTQKIYKTQLTSVLKTRIYLYLLYRVYFITLQNCRLRVYITSELFS